MRVYISGKISGLPLPDAKHNFALASDKIKYMGYVPVNPFEIPLKGKDPSWENYMLGDIEQLFKCQAIYMMKNWRESRGARIEFYIAVEIGLQILFE